MKSDLFRPSFCIPMSSPKGKPVTLNALAAFALEDRQIKYSEVIGHELATLTETHSLLLYEIHEFAKALTSHAEPIFNIVEYEDVGRVSPTKHGSILLSLLTSNFVLISETYPIHVFSPVISVFGRYARNFDSSYVAALWQELTIANARALKEYLDQLVRNLRGDLRTKAIARATSDFRRSASKNFNNGIEALAVLEDEGGQWTSLRFDIHYRPHPRHLPPKARNQIIQELVEVRSLRRKFHRKMRDKFRSCIAGWMCCLEYGAQRGWHYHYLVLLKGAHADSINLIEDLRVEWGILTESGMDWSDNVNKRPHRFTGTGIVNFGYRENAIGLQFIAAYFALGDCFVQIDLSDQELNALGVAGIRTFMMGDFPEVTLAHRNNGNAPMSGVKIKFSDALNRVKFL